MDLQSNAARGMRDCHAFDARVWLGQNDYRSARMVLCGGAGASACDQCREMYIQSYPGSRDRTVNLLIRVAFIRPYV